MCIIVIQTWILELSVFSGWHNVHEFSGFWFRFMQSCSCLLLDCATIWLPFPTCPRTHHDPTLAFNTRNAHVIFILCVCVSAPYPIVHKIYNSMQNEIGLQAIHFLSFSFFMLFAIRFMLFSDTIMHSAICNWNFEWERYNRSIGHCFWSFPTKMLSFWFTVDVTAVMPFSATVLKFRKIIS